MFRGDVNYVNTSISNRLSEASIVPITMSKIFLEIHLRQCPIPYDVQERCRQIYWRSESAVYFFDNYITPLEQTVAALVSEEAKRSTDGYGDESGGGA
jgi:hypothetical protein